LQLLADKNYRKLPGLGDKEEANKLRGDLKKIDAFIQSLDSRLDESGWWGVRPELREEYEAKRKLLLPKRQELEDLAKHIQYRLKEAPDREDAARLKAGLDEIDKEIRGIDFELSSPEWCIQKRKAEQLEKQKNYSDIERAEADIEMLYIDSQLDESGWWGDRPELREEYEVKRKELLPQRRRLQKQAEQIQHLIKQAPDREDVERLRAELDEIDKRIRGIDFELSSPEWCAQKRKAEQLAIQKYNSEIERAKANFNKMTKGRDADYAVTEYDDFVAKRKQKAPIMEGNPWQTTTPPSQQGQAYSPWQPGEKLQSRINQLQDEIRKLSSEMTEMRKLMKVLVEQKKKRPGKPLPEIHDYPELENMEIAPSKKKLPEKPPPEIHGDPLWPENTKPTPSEKKGHEHPPDDIPIELE
jgi:hypothetical protein